MADPSVIMNAKITPANNGGYFFALEAKQNIAI